MLYNNVGGSENNQINLGSRTSSSSEENKDEESVIEKHDSGKNHCASDIEKTVCQMIKTKIIMN